MMQANLFNSRHLGKLYSFGTGVFDSDWIILVKEEQMS